MKVSRDAMLLANPEIVYREEDEGAFLFDPETGDLKSLNPIGGIIWKLCDGTRTFAEIAARIAGHYPDVSRKAIENHLEDFIRDLYSNGYVGRHVDGDVS